MAFHALLKHISKYRNCAIFLLRLSVCAIFSRFFKQWVKITKYFQTYQGCQSWSFLKFVNDLHKVFTEWSSTGPQVFTYMKVCARIEDAIAS